MHNKVRAQRGDVHIVQSRLSQVEVGVAQLAIWLVRGLGSRKQRVHRPPGARRWNEGEPSSPPCTESPFPPSSCVAEPASHGEPIETTASDPIGDSSDALGNAFTREISWTLEVPTLLLLEFKEAFWVLFLLYPSNLISEPFPS